jgi:hypothetical protein
MKFKSRIGMILGYSLVVLIAAFAFAITKTIGWCPIIGPRHRALMARRFESTPVPTDLPRAVRCTPNAVSVPDRIRGWSATRDRATTSDAWNFMVQSWSSNCF